MASRDDIRDHVDDTVHGAADAAAVAVDHLTGQQRTLLCLEVEILEEIFVDTAPDVCDTAVKQILIEKVRDALAMLPQDEREFIVRIFFENRTERQLAQEYCISQVAVNKRKTKILTKIKQIMNF